MQMYAEASSLEFILLCTTVCGIKISVRYIFSKSSVVYNIQSKGKVHPCTDTEALYRLYCP